ncbi:hypothetical protein H257_09386 [Aphanomyces astaci]|uniref:Tc1-like transposase DDE domain-containing protein n=1 Tax=Aphanomyces astaci TaxID=112090 RepID=W4GBD5_APHAT|nr:hypothetical protein H257_09386 [Aphanomyces astaci]ETV76980.1 hypothetical protein H257_09386 [Aphanomyces astaci]|eukprot:XP_009833892.1 hypothetical protein H257_09386 [Aphanomyces astaci]
MAAPNAPYHASGFGRSSPCGMVASPLMSARNCVRWLRAPSKHYITKVMFLAAVASPRYDHHSKTFWDSKACVWPFVQVSPALRGSKNRPKGTLVTVPQAVGSTVYFDAVLNKVVPANMAKFPGVLRHGAVFLQQDNANPHRCVMTELLQTKCVREIVVANQPPNSPDFNVFDLGFLNSIQSIQHQKATFRLLLLLKVRFMS